MKLSANNSERTLMENGMFAYKANATPEEVDNSPEFFDNIVNDLMDAEKYAQSPLSSGLGTTFRLFLGDVHKKFSTSTFRVDGVKTIHAESGVKQYQLLWSRVDDWSHVDVEVGFAQRLKAVEENRGSGRPRKEEAA